MSPPLFRFLLPLSVLVLPAAAHSQQPSEPLEKTPRPNIVVILTDDQGYGDVGLHDNDKIKTPHLDRFAREGIQLTRFYCSPVCAPTRACLMTGRYYYRTGVVHTSRGGAKMDGDEVTIAELLQQSGYRTGIFGKWHLGDNYPMRPQDQGFQECLVHKSGGIGQTPDKPNSYFDSKLWHNGRQIQASGYCTDVFFHGALQFIKKSAQGDGEPFFVYLPTNAPHTPLEVPEEYVAPYRAMGLKDTTARVYGMITNIDDNVGRLLAKLEEWRLRKNTVVLFVTDNGAQQQRYNAGLRGRKSWTYEGGIRVPCYLQWPDRLRGGRKIDRIAAHIDLLPTLLAVAGAKPDQLSLDGRNLLPLLEGSDSGWPDRRLFFQCHRGLTPKPYQNCAVVSQRFKLVGYPGTFSQEDLDTSGVPMLELYDVTADPGEQKDLAAKHPEIVSQMRAAYDAWFDDVRSSRGFRPGRIHVGSETENPTHLCRYQDGNYRDGRPHGWSIQIERAGRYEVTINRGESSDATDLHVTWGNQHARQPLAARQNRAVFPMSAGTGVLDVWVQEPDGVREVVSDNSTLGDVQLERLD